MLDVPEGHDVLLVPQNCIPRDARITWELRNLLGGEGVTASWRSRTTWESRGWWHKWLQIKGPKEKLQEALEKTLEHMWDEAEATQRLPDTQDPIAATQTIWDNYNSYSGNKRALLLLYKPYTTL